MEYFAKIRYSINTFTVNSFTFFCLFLSECQCEVIAPPVCPVVSRQQQAASTSSNLIMFHCKKDRVCKWSEASTLSLFFLPRRERNWWRSQTAPPTAAVVCTSVVCGTQSWKLSRKWHNSQTANVPCPFNNCVINKVNSLLMRLFREVSCVCVPRGHNAKPRPVPGSVPRRWAVLHGTLPAPQRSRLWLLRHGNLLRQLLTKMWPSMYFNLFFYMYNNEGYIVFSGQ